ncbi:MAG: GGDEF domain-containing protein [Actinomycetota bacterium]|nr:GGDEF domain-containing protein [Actinomycetota bacterium]
MDVVDECRTVAGPLPGDPKLRVDLMRRFAVVMFLVGGAASASGFVITAETDDARTTQAIAAAVFVACGLILLVIRTRRWMILTSIVISIANVGGLIAGSEPLGIAPMGYLWPIAFTAFFFPRRIVIVMCALSTASLSVALALNDHHDLKLDSFVGSTASVWVVAGLMVSMNRREDRLRAELELSADTDPLTTLLNRRGFAPQVDRMIALERANDEVLSFVMFDLDQFKQFNDEHGHLVGDDALRRLAGILRRQSGRTDAICRFGGEEFAVAMPGATVRQALAYAQRVATGLHREGEPHWHLTISAGISVLAPDDTVTSLTSRADTALYAAKNAGRDRAAWYHGVMEVAPPFCAASGD